MSKISFEDFGNLKHPKNLKSINNTTSSCLVSCRVISRPATVKGWEKDVFWKIRALGNLKCNKIDNLKSRQNSQKIPEKWLLKVNFFRSIFKHSATTTSNFSWFVRNSKNNCFAKRVCLGYFCSLYITMI